MQSFSTQQTAFFLHKFSYHIIYDILTYPVVQKGLLELWRQVAENIWFGLSVLVGIVTSRDIDFIVEKKDEGASIALRYPHSLSNLPLHDDDAQNR